MNVTVLYEDQLGSGGIPRDYGLHQLIVALVADRLSRPYWEVADRIKAIPLNGSSKVLSSLKNDGLPGCVFALLDEDQIRNEGRVALPHSATISDVLTKLQAVTEAGRPQFVLLRQNSESVIRAAGGCMPAVSPYVAGALKKRLNDRDIVLRKLARSPDPTVRVCVVAKVPSLAILQERIACLLNSAN